MGKEDLFDLLLLACKSGKTEEMKLFIDNLAGFDVNIRYEDGLTLLMLASEYSNIGAVKALLKHGAHINLQKNDGITALMIATSDEGHDEIIEILLENGADSNLKGGKHGLTALMYACLFGYENAVKILLKHGTNTNLQSDITICSALMLAAKEGHENIVKLLLEHGADTNIQDKDGITLLMWATLGGKKEIVKILLKSGSNPDVRRKDGITALMIASSKGHKEIVEILGKHGKELLLKDSDFDGNLFLKNGNNIILENDNLNGRHSEINLYKNFFLSYASSPNYDSQYISIYEYKIDGFKIYQKLIEDKYKNDGEKVFHEVKRGSVLEQNIIDRYNQEKELLGSTIDNPNDKIQELKQKCERHELNFYKIKYFILSNQSKTIGEQKLNIYFKNELERIKLGISKLKELLTLYGFELKYNEEYNYHSFDFKNKETEKILEFKKEFSSILNQTEIEKHKDIIETLNGYLKSTNLEKKQSNEEIFDEAMKGDSYPFLKARYELNPGIKEQILQSAKKDPIYAILLSLELDIEHDYQLANPNSEYAEEAYDDDDVIITPVNPFK